MTLMLKPVKPAKLFSLKSSIVDAYRVLNMSLATTELPAGNYMFKVNSKNGVKYIFKVYNKDTRTTPLASFCCLYC